MRELLDTFVGYSPPDIDEFHRAVARFREDIPHLAASLTTLIDEAKREQSRAFRAALDSFLAHLPRRAQPGHQRPPKSKICSSSIS